MQRLCKESKAWLRHCIELTGNEKLRNAMAMWGSDLQRHGKASQRLGVAVICRGKVWRIIATAKHGDAMSCEGKVRCC